MDIEKVIESFDSIWFTSNILSSPPSLVLSIWDNDEEKKITQSLVLDSPKSKQENSKSPITQIDQVDASNVMDQVQVSTKLEDFETVGAMESDEFVKEEEKSIVETRSHKSNSEGRGKDQRLEEWLNEVVGLIDFGFTFGDTELDGGGLVFPMGHDLQGSRNACFRRKMPPLSDGMAMKEHLKSWAHAVACTVR